MVSVESDRSRPLPHLPAYASRAATNLRREQNSNGTERVHDAEVDETSQSVENASLSREADLELIQLLTGTVQLGNEDEEDASENGERQKKRM